MGAVVDEESTSTGLGPDPDSSTRTPSSWARGRGDGGVRTPWLPGYRRRAERSVQITEGEPQEVLRNKSWGLFERVYGTERS